MVYFKQWQRRYMLETRGKGKRYIYSTEHLDRLISVLRQ